MIACLYGRAFAPFVEPVVSDLRGAAALTGGEIHPLTIEAAVADRSRCAAIDRLYVLPFDPPALPDVPPAPAALVRALFPRAEVVISFAVQELCWDKVATQHRLLDRGVPVPETLMTSDPADVSAFVRHHGFAILKERFSCAGQGHVIVWFDGDRLVGDSGSHRYLLELTTDNRRELRGDRLIYPAPFYLQRLVANIGPRGVTPGQVLRAYIVDNQIVFWTERYRDRYVRPSDWIINVSLGAKYRFVGSVSEETRKIALRSAEVIGARIGVVDLVRTGSSGPYVLAVDTDSYHLMIDRQFKSIPDYREFFNFDRYIAEALLVEPASAQRRPDALE
jgi:hypothetical protein